MPSMMKTLTSSVAVSALLVAVAVGAQARDVTDVDLARTASGSWLHANGSWDGTRYSNLRNLNAGNARNLGVKWIYSLGGETDAQATPLYHDGIL